MSMHMATPVHETAYQDICTLFAKHADQLTAIELLAVAANAVGKMIAMQDQRATTPEQAMEVVARNIEAGNRQVIDHLARTAGRA